jgi:hypothetical protein
MRQIWNSSSPASAVSATPSAHSLKSTKQGVLDRLALYRRPAAAVDIAPETFLKLFSGIRSFSGESGFKSRLFRLVEGCVDGQSIEQIEKSEAA